MFGSDPSFDASPAVQGAPVTGNGFLGMSPNFWNNLAMFGAALSAGANQRTPSGHLANGTGFGGALGAGTLDYMQLQRQNAQARSDIAARQQYARQLGLANDITQMSMPIIEEGNRQALDYMRGVPLPDTQNTTPYGSGDETPVQHSVGQVESGGNPKAVNAQGYAGQYQLGTAALAAAGVYKPAEGEDLSKNEWKGTINLPGFQPMTMQQFAQNPQAQKLAWQAHQANLDKEIQTRGLDSYVGQTVGGVPITHDSLTAMMQIGGPTGTERFLKSGGLYDPADANGTRISDYALKVTGGQPQQASARGVQYAGPGVPQPEQTQGPAPGFDANGRPLPAGWMNAPGPTPLAPPQAPGGAPAQPPATQPRPQPMPAAQPDPKLLALSNQYRQMAITYGRVPALKGMSDQYAQMAQDYFKMAYAGPQAAAVAGAQNPYTLAQKGFQQNPDGSFSYIPGGPADPKYIQSEKGAEARGTADNDIKMDRFGNIYRGTQYLGRGNQLTKVWNPDTQQYEYRDIGGIGIGAAGGANGANGGAASSGGGAPSSGSNAQGVSAGPGPIQQEFLETRGKTLAEQFDKIDQEAIQAIQSNYLFDNLRREGQGFNMGRFADWEGEGRAWLSAMAHTFGINAEGLDKPLADYTAFLKGSGSLLRSAVHETSSRAAAQEYVMIGHTLPTPTTPQEGFNQVADQWQALSDYAIAKQKFAHGYKGNPDDFNVAWNSTASPTSFLINRMSQTESGQRNLQYMVAEMSKTPQGRLQLGRIQAQYNKVKKLGLFDSIDYSQPPQAPSQTPAPAAAPNEQQSPPVPFGPG